MALKTCGRAFFFCFFVFVFVLFFQGKGKKRTPDTFTLRVVCHPLIKVSVNNCVILSDFTGNSSGLRQTQLLLKCIYLLSSQAVNAVKFIQ